MVSEVFKNHADKFANIYGIDVDYERNRRVLCAL